MRIVPFAILLLFLTACGQKGAVPPGSPPAAETPTFGPIAGTGKPIDGESLTGGQGMDALVNAMKATFLDTSRYILQQGPDNPLLCICDVAHEVCGVLKLLTSAQVTACRQLTYSMAAQLGALVSRTVPIPVVFTKTAPEVEDADGTEISVTASTETRVGATVKIFSGAGLDKNSVLLGMILAHEFGHQMTDSQGNSIDDNSTNSAFPYPRGNRAMLNVFGAAVIMTAVTNGILQKYVDLSHDTSSFNGPPIDPLRRWVYSLYRDVLGRQPLPQEVDAQQAAILNGGSRAAVAGAVLHSDEYLTNQVTGIYQTYLRRGTGSSDPVSGWVTQMKNGLDTNGLRQIVLASGEYFNSVSGGTNPSFVTYLYQDVLNRTASQPEVSGWVTVANTAGAGRNSVAQGFLTSYEQRTLQINAGYQRYLRRPATQAESDAIINAHQTDFSELNILAQILSGDEYFAYVGVH